MIEIVVRVVVEVVRESSEGREIGVCVRERKKARKGRKRGSRRKKK